MKIGIIVGSIRTGRSAESVGAWVKSVADARGDENVEYEILDLKSFDIPLLTAEILPFMANKQYDDPRVQAWGDAVDAYDAYVFISPEYNHGVPGALKNAVDSLGAEWMGKPVGIVSYGAEGGVRAVEQWRTILANFSMFVVRSQVSMSIFTEFDEQGLAPAANRAGQLEGLLDEVLAAARKNALVHA